VSLNKSFCAWRLFHSTRLGRRAAALCLFVIFFNLLGPISWIAAHPSLVDGAPLCLASASHENRNDTGQQDSTAIIHCPLCALLASSIAAPPSQAPSVAAFAVATHASFGFSEHPTFVRLPAEQHPSPRGPPAFA
jgi:hypothetical protein